MDMNTNIDIDVAMDTDRSIRKNCPSLDDVRGGLPEKETGESRSKRKDGSIKYICVYIHIYIGICI